MCVTITECVGGGGGGAAAAAAISCIIHVHCKNGIISHVSEYSM